MLWWQSLIVATIQAVFAAGCGSFLAAWIVGSKTQLWIEKRERRNRRDGLRLQLYAEVIAWIEKMAVGIAEFDGTGRQMPVDLQQERLRLYAQLRLLAPTSVQEAFKEYKLRARSCYEDSLDIREADVAQKCYEAREKLLDAMTDDIQRD